MADTSDTEFLDRWRQGDAKAGSMLLRRYFVLVRSYFVNKVPFTHEDLVQETFGRAVANRDRFRGDSSFKVYLLGIARRVLLEHFRARRRDERFEPMETTAFDLDATRPSTLVIEHEQHHLLLDALRHLELRDQEMIELYYWQDLSARQIGELQGVLETTVRGRIRKALERLTRQFEQLSRQPSERELDPQVIEDLLVELRKPLGCQE